MFTSGRPRPGNLLQSRMSLMTMSEGGDGTNLIIVERVHMTSSQILQILNFTKP